MSYLHRWFRVNVEHALGNEVVRRAIGDTAAKKIVSRAAAVSEVDQFEALRELAAGIKQHTLDNLDGYLDAFTRQVEAAGGVVHHVESAAAANACIVRIARDNGSTLCVKAKSMTTEETGLGSALEAAGVRVVETDLGEFIVQIDHDRPSHIVTPIIHKNRKMIAEAFARELGVDYTEDPETLTMHARRHLRDIFQRCDLGISGVNFAVAETGVLCLCTNEGNGRLTTTRPKVHVALMGIEKLVPRMVDLALFLKVLARSSTGQPITVYTSLIHGPRRAGDPDGPERLHVVVLDGGRRDILSSEYREVLRCIRCGACLNACPVYRRIGGHAYDSVYPGPIGKLLTPLMQDFERYADLPQASSLCGQCLEVCPVKIDIPDVLVRLRRDQVRRRTVPWSRRFAFRMMSRVLISPVRYRVAQRLARALTFFGGADGWMRWLPGPMREVTAVRDVPRPAARPFRARWADENKQGDEGPE